MPVNSLLEIDIDNLPKHIAIIMDGNGRWAKSKNKLRVFGHEAGVKTVRKITEYAAKLGIKHLTLYTFSTENWDRPSLEVQALMRLLIQSIKKETKTLQEQNISLKAIGDLSQLPKKVAKELQSAIEETKNNTRMELVLALSYSSKWDLTNAMKQIGKKIADGDMNYKDITADIISEHLQTANLPDPELMIRTSGEHRLSNFLLWELAYSEFHFSPVYWPDFDEDHFYQAIADYQNRKRRFGKTDEQLLNSKESNKTHA